MIRKIAVLTTVAALATTGVALADAPNGGSLTGAGTVTDPGSPFAPVRVGVNARLSDGVPEGRVKVRTDDFSFEGDVQCFVQDGETVRVAGQVVASKELSGGFYALAVRDGGHAGDLISLNASGDVPLDCHQSGDPVFALENGNMTVHGAPVPADTPAAE